MCDLQKSVFSGMTHPACTWGASLSQHLTHQPETIGMTVMHTSLLSHPCPCKLLQSCPTVNPMDCSPPASSVPGTLQARILEWVALSFFNAHMHAKSLQLCPTLCNPVDSSPPGSSVHGILQAKTLEWVATLLEVHRSH